MSKTAPTNYHAGKTVPVDCPKCRHHFKVKFGTLMGRVSTIKKAVAVAQNGKLGGRPVGT